MVSLRGLYLKNLPKKKEKKLSTSLDKETPNSLNNSLNSKQPETEEELNLE